MVSQVPLFSSAIAGKGVDLAGAFERLVEHVIAAVRGHFGAGD